MAFHNYQSGLLFVCIDANVFIIDSWPNALGHTWTVIVIFVNFAALPERSCKLFIYNDAFTTTWFKPGWLISNEIRYADYQFRWNIFCDKTKLDFNKAGQTELGKWNEIISVNLFRVTVWGWYVWCFSSLPARNRSLSWRKICLNKYWLSYTVLTQTSVWTKIYFVIESRCNCQSISYQNDKTIFFATYLMC